MSGGRMGDHRNSETPALRVGPCPHPGKAAYSTKRRAKLSLKRMRSVRARETLRPYLCGCGCWHLGHRPGI